METQKQKEILNELKHFTGTENYYKSAMGNLKYTDGVRYIFQECCSYWFLDVLESYQPQLKEIGFQLWKIAVRDGKTGLITCQEDTNSPVLVSQELEYTDFPLDEITFYCIDGIVLLPSEY